MNLRSNGQSLKSKTKVIFNPLLDQIPSDPSTVLTTVIEAKKITNQANQNITIFATDKQLYRVALEVMCTEPNCFQNFDVLNHEFCFIGVIQFAHLLKNEYYSQFVFFVYMHIIVIIIVFLEIIIMVHRFSKSHSNFVLQKKISLMSEGGA